MAGYLADEPDEGLRLIESAASTARSLADLVRMADQLGVRRTNS